MEIHSPGFADGEEIPDKYTIDGENLSPPLTISGVPARARSLVLIVEDIDSPIGAFTHWVLWNLPPRAETIAENDPPPECEVGLNGFGTVGYAGPCPPSGRHRYRFSLYALESMLDATSPDRKDQIRSDMEGQVIAVASLTGYYSARD